MIIDFELPSELSRMLDDAFYVVFLKHPLHFQIGSRCGNREITSTPSAQFKPRRRRRGTRNSGCAMEEIDESRGYRHPWGPREHGGCCCFGRPGAGAALRRVHDVRRRAGADRSVRWQGLAEYVARAYSEWRSPSGAYR